MDNWVEIPVKREHNVVTDLFNILQGSGGFIAGGFARYVSDKDLGPKASDIDVFTGSQEIFEKVVKALTENNYSIKSLTQASETYTRPSFLEPDLMFCLDYIRVPLPVNVIRPLNLDSFKAAGSMEDIVKFFDLTVSEAVIVSPNSVKVSPECIRDSASKSIVFKALNNVPGTIRRAFKYANKGFTISPEQINILFTAFDNMPSDRKTNIGLLVDYDAMGNPQ